MLRAVCSMAPIQYPIIHPCDISKDYPGQKCFGHFKVIYIVWPGCSFFVHFLFLTFLLSYFVCFSTFVVSNPCNCNFLYQGEELGEGGVGGELRGWKRSEAKTGF